MKSAISAFLNGDLSVNELVVLTAVQAQSNGGSVATTTTAISNAIDGDLSRHAVARALRNLENSGWLSWNTRRGTNRTTTITVG